MDGAGGYAVRAVEYGLLMRPLQAVNHDCGTGRNLDGAGHFPWLESKRFVPVVNSFLNRHLVHIPAGS
jgi:hypothetical protein